MSEVTGKAWDKGVFMRVMRYANPYKGLLYFALLLTILLTISSVIRPVLMGQMVGEYIQKGDDAGLLQWTIVIILLLIFETVAQFFYTYIANVIGQRVIKDLRVELFSHIVKLKLKYFDNNPIGMLVTRAVSDVETVADIFSQGILVIFGDLLKLTGVLVMMFVINWQLTLMIILPIPILLWATNIFKKAIKKAFQDVRTNVSRLNTFVQERITGMNIVNIFNRQKIEAERFRSINKEHRKAHIKSVWAYSIFMPVVEILSALSIALLILYTVARIDDADANLEVLFSQMTAFIFYVFMLYRPIRMLADRFNILQMGMVGSSRVFKVLDTDETIINEGTISNKDFKGAIDFKDVWFAYNEPNYVLKELNFSVQSGETVAFVGATGAGKTSIINLLSRFYEYQKGQIIVDGDDLKSIELNTIRKNIAVVLQDVFLYSDTILNNITLGDPTISKEKVIEAAKLVGAHDFIMKLPGDYDFDVKERGGMLSSGQRQLIVFIRAYVFNPAILVLDEATSSIDTESEELIQKAIDLLTQGRTSIVIAHRLSTISKADKIIVLDHGEVIEMGSHTDLLEQGGAYKNLYDLQFKS